MARLPRQQPSILFCGEESGAPSPALLSSRVSAQLTKRFGEGYSNEQAIQWGFCFISMIAVGAGDSEMLCSYGWQAPGQVIWKVLSLDMRFSDAYVFWKYEEDRTDTLFFLGLCLHCLEGIFLRYAIQWCLFLWKIREVCNWHSSCAGFSLC